MAKLYMMIGIPGSGKSTFAKRNPNATIISRDDIRFKMVKEDEEYFSREKEVFAEFCKQINTELILGKDTIADATHISFSSRAKLLNQVKEYDELIAVVLDTPCEIALKQNENRKGTRSYVPQEVIKKMSKNFNFPDKTIEPFNRILLVNSNGLITEII